MIYYHIRKGIASDFSGIKYIFLIIRMFCGVGKAKGILDVVDLTAQDLDDVKADVSPEETLSDEVLLRGQNDLTDLLWGDSLDGITVVGVLASFDLYKDDDFPVAGDQIDLPHPTRKILFEDSIPLLAKIVACRRFPFDPDLALIHCRRNA